MSDDLVKRLMMRLQEIYDRPHDFSNGQKSEAAGLARDRIEELESENRRLRDAVCIDDLTVKMQANDRSKALAGIGRALDFLNADMPNEAKAALRSTLAELTGGKP